MREQNNQTHNSGIHLSTFQTRTTPIMRLTTTTALSYLLGLAAALPTQTASPTPTSATGHLEIRQGAVVTGVAAATVEGQVSPITTVQIGYLKDGAYVQVQEIYTQTFALPIDQWPAATQGAIGLGTIQGEIGVVKSKRDAMPTQILTPQTEVLTLEKLRVMMDEMPVEEETGVATRDLVLTKERYNKILAAMPPEKRDVVITRELLDSLMD